MLVVISLVKISLLWSQVPAPRDPGPFPTAVTVIDDGCDRVQQPFELVASDGDDKGLLALVKAAPYRRKYISTEEFIPRILGYMRDDRAVSLLLRAVADDHWLIRTPRSR